MRALSIEECDLVSGGIEEIIIYGSAPPSSDPNVIAAYLAYYSDLYYYYSWTYYWDGGSYSGGTGYTDSGLVDVTTNPDHPRYQVDSDTVIELNHPSPTTVLPSGATLESLKIFADQTGLATVVVTGGAEQGVHGPNSRHDANLAVDIAGTQFHNLTDQQVLAAAQTAGFTHAIYEHMGTSSTADDHWHLQIGPGGGLDESHELDGATTIVHTGQP